MQRGMVACLLVALGPPTASQNARRLEPSIGELVEMLAARDARIAEAAFWEFEVWQQRSASAPRVLVRRCSYERSAGRRYLDCIRVPESKREILAWDGLEFGRMIEDLDTGRSTVTRGSEPDASRLSYVGNPDAFGHAYFGTALSRFASAPFTISIAGSETAEGRDCLLLTVCQTNPDGSEHLYARFWLDRIDLLLVRAIRYRDLGAGEIMAAPFMFDGRNYVPVVEHGLIDSLTVDGVQVAARFIMTATDPRATPGFQMETIVHPESVRGPESVPVRDDFRIPEVLGAHEVEAATGRTRIVGDETHEGMFGALILSYIHTLTEASGTGQHLQFQFDRERYYLMSCAQSAVLAMSALHGVSYDPTDPPPDGHDVDVAAMIRRLELVVPDKSFEAREILLSELGDSELPAVVLLESADDSEAHYVVAFESSNGELLFGSPRGAVVRSPAEFELHGLGSAGSTVIAIAPLPRLSRTVLVSLALTICIGVAGAARLARRPAA